MKDNVKIQNASYGVICCSDPSHPFSSMFITTFFTKNEKEAMTLSKCIAGTDEELSIIDGNGEIW